jgi:hypothetical protein
MRRQIPFFVAYAHGNQRLADDFLIRLRQQMTPSRAYDYRLWRDTMLLVGEDWDQEIKAALQASELGLLLLSPAFLGSDYITRIEWPYFLATGKPVIPVMLEPVDFARHDLRGLEEKQIFRWTSAPGAVPRAYADCRGVDRRRFVEGLFLQIEKRLDKLASVPTP